MEAQQQNSTYKSPGKVNSPQKVQHVGTKDSENQTPVNLPQV